MKHSYTQDVTSEVANRVNEAIQTATRQIGVSRLDRIRAVQRKVEKLSQLGLLNRQEFAAATRADFQKLFLKKG